MAPPPLPTPPALASDGRPASPTAVHRPRPRPSEQVRIIRELWLLREQARVQAAERHFLAELQRVLHRTLANIGETVPPQNAPLRRRELREAMQPSHAEFHSENEAANPESFISADDSDCESRNQSPGGEEHDPVTRVYDESQALMQNANISTEENQRNMLFLGPDVDPLGATDVVLLDGVTFENNPPPRNEETAPVRERPGHTLAEVQHLRRQQHVTNLSPTFRAILEGTAPPEIEPRALSRTRSWGVLSDQRAVSNTLDSSFRHELESVLVRRSSRHHARRYRDLYTNGSDQNVMEHNGNEQMHTDINQLDTNFSMSDGEDEDMEFSVSDTGAYDHEQSRDSRQVGHPLGGMSRSRRSSSNRALENAVRALSAEVNVLKNVIGASFDMQLDIQRAIRQEVSAAMNQNNRPHVASFSDNVGGTVSACTEGNSSASNLDNHGSGEGGTMSESTEPEGERSNSTDHAVCLRSTETSMSSRPASNGMSVGNTSQLAIDSYRLASSGTCIVCLESRVDSLLYGCGHMCSCSMCGRHLIASGQPCPICRAPIRDVVRVYMVAE